MRGGGGKHIHSKFSKKAAVALLGLTPAAVPTSGQLVVQVAQRADEALAGLLGKVLPVVVPLLVRPATHPQLSARSNTRVTSTPCAGGRDALPYR